MKPSLEAVAEKAGVSTATVSRALNDRAGVNPETREKILLIARDMGYMPNAAAKGLATSRTYTLGLIISDRPPQEPITNFPDETILGVDQEARDRGYHVITTFVSGDMMQDALRVPLVSERRTDGLILVGPTDAEDVAEVFALTVEQPDGSAGRMFSAAAAYALTFADLVTTYSRIYGVEIPVRSVEWDEFDLVVRPTPDQRYHHEAHMCADITAARRTLGYEPKYTPEAALQRAVEWMRAKEML